MRQAGPCLLQATDMEDEIAPVIIIITKKARVLWNHLTGGLMDGCQGISEGLPKEVTFKLEPKG